MKKPTIRSFAEIIQKGKKPVIMQVVPALDGSGGVEQSVIDLNKAIVEAGGVSIVVSNGGIRIHEITRHGGINVELPVHSKNPITMFRNIERLKKVIQKYDVDIVHACSRAPAWSAKPATKGTKAIYMTSCHATHKINFFGKTFYNSSMLNGDLVIAISNTIADYLKNNYRFDHDKLRIVQRGVDLNYYDPETVSQARVIALAQKWHIPEDKLFILYPARVSSTKGHLFFLDALEKLNRKDIFTLIVGRTDGNEKYVEKIKKAVRKKKLESQVRVLGDWFNDETAGYMLSNVVVCPTTAPEAFGRIPIISMAMGKPFIGTNLGGYCETVTNDKTGWLVEPDDAESLAASLDKALSMKQQEREKFAKRARKHVSDNFSNKKMCGNTLDVYAELLCINNRC